MHNDTGPNPIQFSIARAVVQVGCVLRSVVEGLSLGPPRYRNVFPYHRFGCGYNGDGKWMGLGP